MAALWSERVFWHDYRLRRLGKALCLAIVAALFAVMYSDLDNTSSLKSGDFAGFYAPAVIAANGQWDRLYDAALQRDLENSAWPNFSNQYYMSVYPPFVAVLLKPLGHLSPENARLIFFIISLAAYTLTILILASFNRFIRKNLLFSFSSLLLAGPLFAGVLGGQNTAISMLLLTASAWCIRRSIRRSSLMWEYISGALLGIWMIKPQFGCLAVALLLFAGFYRSFIGALTTATGLFFLGYFYAGLQPYFDWIDALFAFSPMNYSANLHEQSSLIGFAKALSLSIKDSTHLSFTSLLVASLLSFCLVIVVVVKMRHARQALSKYVRLRAVSNSFFSMGALIPLISPQTLFYDLGISIICAARFFAPDKDSLVRMYFELIILLGVMCYFRDSFLYPPFVFFSLLVFIYSLSKQNEKTNFSKN